MPLNKAKQAEWMREYRKKLKQGSVIPKIDALQSKSKPLKSLMNRTASSSVIPKSESVIPKLPWYAGAGNHFGVIRNGHYARQFFSSLFEGL